MKVRLEISVCLYVSSDICHAEQIFGVIFAFCATSVVQNVGIRREIGAGVCVYAVLRWMACLHFLLRPGQLI